MAYSLNYYQYFREFTEILADKLSFTAGVPASTHCQSRQKMIKVFDNFLLQNKFIIALDCRLKAIIRTRLGEGSLTCANKRRGQLYEAIEPFKIFHLIYIPSFSSCFLCNCMKPYNILFDFIDSPTGLEAIKQANTEQAMI